MFEGDLGELATVDVLSAAAEFARIQERAAVRVLEAAVAYADQNAVLPGYEEPLPGHERLLVYGGDGCPGVTEFAPIELGAVMRMSSGAASTLLGEALALRHRLPRIWAAVLAGTAVSWRARSVARACLSLSIEAAALVDRRVVGIVNTVTPGALNKIVTAAVWEADPEQAKAQAEAVAKQRGVFVAPSDDHGTKRIWVRAAAGAVIRFDATIDDLARALKTLGDTDTLDQRRAKAIDWISDPEAAQNLLEVARHLARSQSTSQPSPQPDPAEAGTSSTDSGTTENLFTRRMLADELPARLAAIKQHGDRNGRRANTTSGASGTDTGTGAVRGSRRNRHTLYVHLTDYTLATSNGVLRVEELGPILASQLTELLGHDQVVLKPVIDLHDQVSVHSYEIPDRIRERVRLQHPVDTFPYGAAEATARTDLDHITPYRNTAQPTPPEQAQPPDPPGQTGTHNLTPLSRLHHRAKTHGGWRNHCLPTGAIEWTSPHGFHFIVDHTGTHPTPPTDRDKAAG